MLVCQNCRSAEAIQSHPDVIRLRAGKPNPWRHITGKYLLKKQTFLFENNKILIIALVSSHLKKKIPIEGKKLKRKTLSGQRLKMKRCWCRNGYLITPTPRETEIENPPRNRNTIYPELKQLTHDESLRYVNATSSHMFF